MNAHRVRWHRRFFIFIFFIRSEFRKKALILKCKMTTKKQRNKKIKKKLLRVVTP